MRFLVSIVISLGLTACGVPPLHAQHELTIHWQDRFLEVRGESIPGGPIRIHYLEAYCRAGSTDREWHETVIPHESRQLFASQDGKRIHLEDRLADGVIVEHDIRIDEDSVTFLVEARNPTNKESEVHWAQPCMRVDRFTAADRADAQRVFPPYIKKCFLMLEGKPTRLPTRPWALEARYVPGQVYAASEVPRDDVNPRPLSQRVPSSGLAGCFSADEKMMVAIAWEPFQEIFQGVVTCLHSDFRIGGLQPAEMKTIRGKLYLVPSELDKLVARYRRDFAK